MPGKSTQTAPKKKPIEKANKAKSLEKKPKVAKATPTVLQAQPVKAEKPAKPKSARARASAAAAEEAMGKLASKWNSFFKKADDIKSAPYSMKNSYEPKTAITHKILGWGYILENKNDRLEVLFKDGIKFLISNYK